MNTKQFRALMARLDALEKAGKTNSSEYSGFSYKELQNKAKEQGIRANQSHEALVSALSSSKGKKKPSFSEKKKNRLNIGGVWASPYSKKGDRNGFKRFRINGNVVVDGIKCHINGYVTEKR